MNESDHKNRIDGSDGGKGGQEGEKKQEEQSVDEQETEQTRAPSAAGQQGRRDTRHQHHSSRTAGIKETGRYGEDDGESVAAIQQSSRNLNTNTTIVESLPSTTPVPAQGPPDTNQEDVANVQQGQSISAGAYAVRGQHAVRRVQGEGRESLSHMSSSELSTPPHVQGSGSTALQPQQSQPIVVEAELAQPNEEVLQARMEAQRLREQLNALEARVDEMQPTAQVAVAHGSNQQSSQPILVRAEPMDGREEAPVDESSDEGLRLSSPVMEDHSLSNPYEGEEEEDFDILPSSGDITPRQSSSEDAAGKKKRARLMVLGTVLLLVIAFVFVAVARANQSSSSSPAAEQAPVVLTSVPTPSPTTRRPTSSPAAEQAPVALTSVPTPSPTTRSPTRFPTRNPTKFPTRFPTFPPNAPSPNNPWTQLGQAVNGSSVKDSFGNSISLSRDATVMAVGADQFDSTNPGYVSVVQFNAQTRAWRAMGQELVGEASGDLFGWSVSLNGDGTILAVGAVMNDGGAIESGGVRVYEYDTTSTRWEQLGIDIDGEAHRDGHGVSVSLSDRGDVLAVGASVDNTNNGRDSGSVRLFQYNRGSTSWRQMGQTLIGQAADDRFGRSVSLNRSGTVVAIGAYQNDMGGPDAGQASVFQYNSASSTWVPMGSPISGQFTGGWFGVSVSLDDSGAVIAVGGLGSGVSYPESVLVFEFDSATSEWMQRGQTLVYEFANGDFGRSVSLSSDGNVVAVGIPFRDAVRIYKYEPITNRWDQVGEDLNAEAAFEQFGSSVSLSGNGTVVGVGAEDGNPNGVMDAGYAMVFTLN